MPLSGHRFVMDSEILGILPGQGLYWFNFSFTDTNWHTEGK